MVDLKLWILHPLAEDEEPDETVSGVTAVTNADDPITFSVDVPGYFTEATPVERCKCGSIPEIGAGALLPDQHPTVRVIVEKFAES